jgi:ADP-heptose:LPS heptosyltransferase
MVPQHAPSSRTSSRATRVLLIRPDHVGDVLLTAPAVALLAQSLPDARLTYLVGPWSAAAARHGPTVAEVRPLAFPGFTRQAGANLLAPYLLLLRTAASLRRERYDAAVVLRGDDWWGALLALTAGIPIRVGGDTPETRPLLTHLQPLDPSRPWPEQALATARLALRALCVPAVETGPVQQFAPGPTVTAAATRLWRQQAFTRETVVGIHPSAGAPLKSWPTERWADLADQLLDAGFDVLLIGAPDDADLLSTIAQGMRGRAGMLCGQSLEVSAALYARCALLVSVDSGAGHLAAAVGVRTVRLYGPASAAIFGPWPSDASQRVLATRVLACAPCGFLESPPCGARASPACMLALDVKDVLNAVSVQLMQR